MGMLYSAKIETMMPKLHSQHFEGMELIRPLYLVKEADIKAWRDSNDLHFIQCACRFTENCATCGGGRGSKRDEMKELIALSARPAPSSSPTFSTAYRTSISGRSSVITKTTRPTASSMITTNAENERSKASFSF